LKFLTFRCHLKFSKFNLNKMLHKFPSFWKFFKLLFKQWNSPQSIWIPSKLHSLETFLHNVLRELKYVEVNFIVCIIIWRIFKMKFMEYFVQTIIREFQMTHLKARNFKFLHCYNFLKFCILVLNISKIFKLTPQFFQKL